MLKHIFSPLKESNEQVNQADLLFQPSSRAVGQRNAVRDDKSLWPYGIVPYKISSSFSKTDQIRLSPF